MSFDLFDEINFDELGKQLYTLQPEQPLEQHIEQPLEQPKHQPAPQVRPKIPDMLTKKSKLTAKQLAKSPMAQLPIISDELSLCIKVNNEKFIITGGAIALSGLLSDWRKKNPDQNEIMLSGQQQHKTTHAQSTTQPAVQPFAAAQHLNTPQLIKYIIQYLDMWAGYYTHCDYPIRLPIRTSDVSQVLYSQDWRFIKSYIDAEAQPVQIVALQTGALQAGYIEHAKSLNLKTKSEIAALVKLLDQAEYLKIDSLEKKIYTYAAALLYDKTAVDIHAM
jgi:hypothetical protein